MIYDQCDDYVFALFGYWLSTESVISSYALRIHFCHYPLVFAKIANLVWIKESFSLEYQNRKKMFKFIIIMIDYRNNNKIKLL